MKEQKNEIEKNKNEEKESSKKTKKRRKLSFSLKELVVVKGQFSLQAPCHTGTHDWTKLTAVYTIQVRFGSMLACNLYKRLRSQSQFRSKFYLRQGLVDRAGGGEFESWWTGQKSKRGFWPYDQKLCQDMELFSQYIG